MIFDRETYKRFFHGYDIIDCTIGFEDGRLGFLLAEIKEGRAHDDPYQLRLLAVKRTNPVDTRFFSMSTNALSHWSDLCSAWEPGHAEFVGVDTGRTVYGYKPKVHKGQEARIPFHRVPAGAEARYDSIVRRTVRAGTAVFAVGWPFRVYERLGPDQWREHTDIPLPEGLDSTDEDTFDEAMGLDQSSFHYLAGRSALDLYVVGSRGAVWRRQGQAWRQLAFPSDLSLRTVAVAPNGTAYITDENGRVWKGQDDGWRCLTPVWRHYEGFKDSAWFAGRLWCTGDKGGLYVLQGRRMVLAQDARAQPMPWEFSSAARRLDVSPDGRVLLIAGGVWAAQFDGSDWKWLIREMPKARDIADGAIEVLASN
jgi:hypothetical protein